MSSTSAPAAWLAPLLAMTAGFVDTTGFIVFAGLFLAHVTGNFVVLGASLSGQEYGSALTKLAVLPLFVAGVVLGWTLDRIAGGSGARRVALAECAALMLCGGLGTWIKLGGVAGFGIEFAAIALGVLAMGMQSILAKSLQLPMTHVMTGNVTQLTVDVLNARFASAATWGAARKNIVLVCAFAAGAVGAGLLVPRTGLMAMFVPGVALLPIVAAGKTMASRR